MLGGFCIIPLAPVMISRDPFRGLGIEGAGILENPDSAGTGPRAAVAVESWHLVVVNPPITRAWRRLAGLPEGGQRALGG